MDRSPTWYPDFGIAEVAVVTVEIHQNVSLPLLKDVVETLPKPVYNANVSARYTRDTLQLDKVAGAWQSFDKRQTTFDDDPQTQEIDKKLGAARGAQLRNSHNRDRDRCDYCHLLYRVKSPPAVPVLQRVGANNSNVGIRRQTASRCKYQMQKLRSMGLYELLELHYEGPRRQLERADHRSLRDYQEPRRSEGASDGQSEAALQSSGASAIPRGSMHATSEVGSAVGDSRE